MVQVCGRKYHDDFSEVRPGAISDIQTSLKALYHPRNHFQQQFNKLVHDSGALEWTDGILMAWVSLTECIGIGDKCTAILHDFTTVNQPSRILLFSITLLSIAILAVFSVLIFSEFESLREDAATRVPYQATGSFDDTSVRLEVERGTELDLGEIHGLPKKRDVNESCTVSVFRSGLISGITNVATRLWERLEGGGWIWYALYILLVGLWPQQRVILIFASLCGLLYTRAIKRSSRLQAMNRVLSTMKYPKRQHVQQSASRRFRTHVEPSE